jgi:hypothetical protein
VPIDDVQDQVVAAFATIFDLTVSD